MNMFIIIGAYLVQQKRFKNINSLIRLWLVWD